MEKAEDIELLRFVEHGIKVKVKEITSNTISVDTPKDLERVRAMERKLLMNCAGGGIESIIYGGFLIVCGSSSQIDTEDWRAA